MKDSSGKSFDAAYVRDLMTVHRQLQEAERGFRAGRPTSLDSVHTTMMARTVIEVHLTMLHDLQPLLQA